MALPNNGIAWPPTHLATIRADMNIWAAWYANDTGSLTNAYGKQTGTTNRKGVINRVIRWFWTNNQTDLTQPQERKLHVPIASDLAQASSDLLFSEPPSFTADLPTNEDGEVTDTATQARVDLITGPAFQQVLVGGAETSAALGGVYFRAMWDSDVAAHVFVRKVDADMAWPEFRHGQLTAVTFWQVVRTNNTEVWRHLERHETDAQGIGVIVHGLYRGTVDNLGQRVPFQDDPATEWLAAPDVASTLINGDTLSTFTPGLAVYYAPNVTPSRAWRNDPVGCELGRSDYDGIEPLMDALDEAYSSLMRDIRLGKSMLIVPQSMLQSNGPGQGASFQQNEVFTGVNAAPSAADSAKLAIEEVQFKIRVEEHEQAIMLLFKRIIGSAGYSTQTFGEGGDVAITATEVASRERRSYMTRDRKIRSLVPALEGVVSKALAMDAAVFPNSGAVAVPVQVQFADGVQEDPEALARTAQMLALALSASIETRVRLLHKDWDEPAIKAEVEKIKTENGVQELEDPETFGADGAGLTFDQALAGAPAAG